MFTESDSEIDNYNHIVHIRLQQRNGRKTITIVHGIDDKYDLNKLTQVFKKEFACNGCVDDDKIYGKCIKLQGNHTKDIYDFLLEVFVYDKVLDKSNIKIHG